MKRLLLLACVFASSLAFAAPDHANPADGQARAPQFQFFYATLRTLAALQL